jgi:proteasome lid subunit RPN8/RPN11
VADGEPIRVFGIIFSNFGVAKTTITFRNPANTKTYMRFYQNATDTDVMDIKFIADQGLVIDSSDDVTVIVFHSHPGN